jgi:hypothetical protein
VFIPDYQKNVRINFLLVPVDEDFKTIFITGEIVAYKLLIANNGG